MERGARSADTLLQSRIRRDEMRCENTARESPISRNEDDAIGVGSLRYGVNEIRLHRGHVVGRSDGHDVGLRVVPNDVGDTSRGLPNWCRHFAQPSPPTAGEFRNLTAIS